MNYRLEGNKRNNLVDVLVFEDEENSKSSIMKLRLNEFIEEFDKFYNDDQDSMFVKADDYYQYGGAIEFHRNIFSRKEDSIYACIYCGFYSGLISDLCVKDLKSFVDNHRR